MLDIAIIGGGLSGLSIAYHLQQQGKMFALFEARERFGGRILSIQDNGMALDLGPSWYWPDTQPRIARLIAALGLESYPQHNHGTILNLADPDKAPQAYVTNNGVHEGSQRLAGGMGSLVQALLGTLPADGLHNRHVLNAVIDRGDHVEMHVRCGENMQTVTARQVVLAVPPRMLEEHVRFEPPLDDATRQSMRSTYTWMADQAKVVVTYPQSFWRKAGLSGNAFVGHEQAMLYETFDACDAEADHAALGGFVALTPEQRTSYALGMPLLINSQLVQLFGQEADNGMQHIQDWATEVYTSSMLDQTPPVTHPAYDDVSLRRPRWKFKLYFCGSETAQYAAGYMEGALEAGERVLYLLDAKSGQALKVSPKVFELKPSALRSNL